MKEIRFPARLHVLVPKNSANALVIRRGPSKETCVLSWDTTNDRFAAAQWLKERIYERRSDISPNGKFWIYFAMNGQWKSRTKGSWTAIARAPWLKAISLFAKGDCWHGGGLFVGNRSYWLNNGYGHEKLADTSELTSTDPPEGLQYFGGECPTVYYNRLMRARWLCSGRIENGRHDGRTIFEKPLPRGWTFRKICHEQIGAPKGKGCYWDEHSLISKSGSEVAFPDWEWAELVNSHITFAKDGCLFRTRIKSAGELSDVTLIHDFNEYKFENREAPY